MKKKRLLFLIIGSLWACSAPVTLAETYSCTGDRDNVRHFIEMTAKDGKVEKFDYSSSTPVSGSVNNCSIDSSAASATDLPNGERDFALPDNNIVIVLKSGSKFTFDFSKISIEDFCGQSSTIARRLTIMPGIKHCSGIDNF